MKKAIKQLQMVFLGFYNSPARRILLGAYLIAIVGGLSGTLWQKENAQQALVAVIGQEQQKTSNLSEEKNGVEQKLAELEGTDERVRNEALVATMSAMTMTFDSAGGLFERRSDLAKSGIKMDALDLDFAKFLAYLSKQNYASASALTKAMDTAMDKLVAAQVVAIAPIAKAPESNSLPGDGYTRQTVSTSRGSFVISMVIATGARVIVDTAGDSDCGDNCPVLPLADYVARNGAFAGINGSYFCPPDYARCQGKVNTFDTLVFNGRNKKAFNQGNNVYSVVPLMAAYGSNLNFYSKTLEWGVDSGSTGAIANHPLLLRGGNIAFDEGNLEAYQRDGKGTKGFIGTKGSAIVIGHVFGATVPEEAEVLKTLGLENALNLDGGGSSALWSGGYKVGPGRLLPTAVLLVR